MCFQCRFPVLRALAVFVVVRALFKLKVNVNVSVQPSVVRSDGLSYGERGEIESSYDQNTFILNVIEVVENNSPLVILSKVTLI